MLGDDCPARLTTLTESVNSRVARPDAVRAGVAAISAIAATSDEGCAALAGLLGNAMIRDQVVIGFGGAALRNPDHVLKWLASLPEAQRSVLVDALREAFERFEEDYAEEQFFASARATYWSALRGRQREL